MARPWMPLYVADYLSDTLDLRSDETGVYMLMLMLAWRRPDGALPNDMKWLQRALSSCASDMHGNRFNRIVPMLLERFFLLGDDDKFRNKRLTKEREKAEKFSVKQRENINKRYSKTNEINNLEDTNVLPARPSQSQSQSQREDKKEPRASALAAGWPNDFREQFWQKFPNKVGKPKALAKLESCMRRGIAFGEIMMGLESYIRNKPPDRAWLNPETFINQERWSDQPARTENGNGSHGIRTNPGAGPAPTRDATFNAAMARTLERRRAERAANDPGRQDFREGGCPGLADRADANGGSETGHGRPPSQLAFLPRGDGVE